MTCQRFEISPPACASRNQFQLQNPIHTTSLYGLKLEGRESRPVKLPRLWHSPNQNLGKEIVSQVKAHQGQVLESVQKKSRSRMDRRDGEESLTRLMLSNPDLEGDPLKLLRTSEAFWKVFYLLNSFQNWHSKVQRQQQNNYGSLSKELTQIILSIHEQSTLMLTRRDRLWLWNASCRR